MLHRLYLGLTLAAALPATALGHIAIAESRAAPGAYHVASFRVGHGCAGADTVAIRVEIAPGVESAKPQPKPGWTLETAPGAVTWRGRLPDAQFDTFALLLKLPRTPATLYFPTLQTCAGGAETRWTEIPAPGAAWTSVPHPAPVLTLSGEDDAPHGHAHP